MALSPRVTLQVRPIPGSPKPNFRRYEILVDGKPIGGVQQVHLSMDRRGAPIARLVLIPDEVNIEVDTSCVVERRRPTGAELLAGAIDVDEFGTRLGCRMAKLQDAVDRRLVLPLYRGYAATVRIARLLKLFRRQRGGMSTKS